MIHPPRQRDEVNAVKPRLLPPLKKKAKSASGMKYVEGGRERKSRTLGDMVDKKARGFSSDIKVRRKAS